MSALSKVEIVNKLPRVTPPSLGVSIAYSADRRRDPTPINKHEGTVSGGKVNWLINGLCGERLPAIDLAHVDLP